jgi:hypothetical protein
MNKSFKILLTIGVLISLAISLVALYKQYSPEPIKAGSSYAPFQNFTSFTKTAATTTAVQVLSSNPGREYALFTNNSDTAIYLNFSSASTTLDNYAVRLNATGGVYEMSAGLGNLYSGEVWASSTAANKEMLTLEK